MMFASLQELDAPVEHIVLPTFAYEHKVSPLTVLEALCVADERRRWSRAGDGSLLNVGGG
jgi:hypothetical protein